MSSENKPIDQPVGDQTLRTLLTLDERLRSRRDLDSPIAESPESNDPTLRAGMEALLELEAAIPRSSHSMPSWAPRRIGRFELRSVLGAGGFAVVYLAYDPQLNRQVALKVPRPHALIQPELRQRFVNEARAAARLDHPAIVHVFEAGSDEDLPYIACALCEGPTLEEWLASQNGLMNSRLAAKIMIHLADGLHYSHERGILHRDIKPGNVLLFPAGFASRVEFPFHARISDFGLAKLLEDPQLDSVTSQLIGTPRFMAPELLGSTTRTSSVAADVYSLGAVLYAMLTGQAPFGSASLAETMQSIAVEDPVAPELINRSVGKDLSLICLKCLEKNPGERYRSAAELRDDLQRFLSGQCVVARQTPLVIRARKWIRRHPLIGAVSLVTTVFVVFLIAMVIRYTTSLTQLQGRLRISNDQLRSQVVDLNNAVGLAEDRQAELIQERRRVTNLLRIADVNLAARAWQQGDPKGAFQLLKSWRSGEDSDQDGKSSGSIALDYLWQRTTAEYQQLAKSSQAIWWLRLDPPGRRLLAAGSRGNLDLVNLSAAVPSSESGLSTVMDAKTLTLQASASELSCADLSDDRTLAATSSDDGTVTVWTVSRNSPSEEESLTRLREIRVLERDPVYGVFFLPDTHRLLTCSRSSVLTIWDAETGERVRDVTTRHSKFIESVTFSADRTLLATAGSDGLIEVFSLPKFSTVADVQASEKPISKVAFSHDGRLLICGGWDRTVHVFSLETLKEVLSYSSLAAIYGVACNSQNQLLAGDRDGVLTLLKIPGDLTSVRRSATGVLTPWRPLKRWAGHDVPVSAICWMDKAESDSEPDGAWISADRSGNIRAWSLKSSTFTWRMPPASRSTMPEDRFPVICSVGDVVLRAVDGDIEIFSMQSMKKLTTKAVESTVTSLAARRTGKDLSDCQIFAGDSIGQLYIVNDAMSDHSHLETLKVFEATPVRSLMVPDAGSRLVLISDNNELAVLDLSSRQIVYRAQDAKIAALTEDGRQIVHGILPGDRLQIVDLANGKVVAELAGHQSTVSKIRFTSDGSACITASHDRTVCYWDMVTGAQIRQLTGHRAAIGRLAISRTGEMIATGDDEGVIRLWDTATGRELLQLDEQIPQLIDMRFTDDDCGLVCWDLDQDLHVLSLSAPP